MARGCQQFLFAYYGVILFLPCSVDLAFASQTPTDHNNRNSFLPKRKFRPEPGRQSSKSISSGVSGNLEKAVSSDFSEARTPQGTKPRHHTHSNITAGSTNEGGESERTGTVNESEYPALSTSRGTTESDSTVEQRDERPSHASLSAILITALREIMTVERCKSLILLGSSFWLLKKIFQEVGSLVEELQDELKEDHDNLLFSPTIMNEVASVPLFIIKQEDTRNEQSSNDKSKRSKSRRNSIKWSKSSSSASMETNPKFLTSKHRFARELVLKLHLAGLPLDSQVQEAIEKFQSQTSSQDNSNVAKGSLRPTAFPSISMPKTAESVLRSLTKAEGQMLSNCLLLPEDALQKLVQNAVAPISPTKRRAEQMEEWNKIGGLNDVKESLLDLVYPLMAAPPPPIALQSQTNANANPYYGDLLSHPPGVMLYGPPGCGKTVLAKALAYTAGARFLCVTHSSLLRKYVGETNLKVKALFSLARKLQPCIIFVDEVDGLFRERQTGGSSGGSDEHDVSRDLKTEFMQLWDGISSHTSDRILVMGATNRPFDVDSAFLRRMPRSYFVGLPDEVARVSILQTLLKGVPLAPGFDMDLISKEVQGYSPSDLKEMLRVAALFPFREARASAAASLRNRNANGNGMEDLSPFTPAPPIPPLRPLATLDVLHARRTVAPTQYSDAYRSAMSEYVSRSNASLTQAPYNYGASNANEPFGPNTSAQGSDATFFDGEDTVDDASEDEDLTPFSDVDDDISSFDDDE
jgi:ATP-dependent 26S proteasome regulatory subunit